VRPGEDKGHARLRAVSEALNRQPHAQRLVAAALLLAASVLPAAGQARDSAALVTVLGSDTVALERWVRTGNRWEAAAVVRSPSTSFRRYTLELAPSGSMRRFEERWYDAPSLSSPPRRIDVVEPAGSGWVRRITEGDSTRLVRFEADSSALPFVDLVHWPLELAIARVPAGETRTQPLIVGGRAIPFTVARTAGSEVTVTHPLRGPSQVRVDAWGRLQRLDAAQTTRKVVVTRVPWVELEAPARRWAAADAAGRGLGELSGRGREEATVAGARILVDYGTPSRRGREIWGGIVPWGQLWRTGANRATHLTTSRDLVLGDPARGGLVVPAGEYTLFSVPEASGGVLIVNRQTGQNGTSYDPARDLGRVPMRRVARGDSAERFTVEVDEAGAGGVIRLIWDRSEFVVPFAVR